MAITTALCNQAKQDFLDGVHASGDTYKIALFTSSASLDKTTTAYSTTNEVSGTGYSAGGATLSGRATTLTGDVASIDFADPSWSSSTITARGAMIYNSSKSNKSLAVFDFGADVSSSSSTFTVNIPASGVGVIRFS